MLQCFNCLSKIPRKCMIWKASERNPKCCTFPLLMTAFLHNTICFVEKCLYLCVWNLHSYSVWSGQGRVDEWTDEPIFLFWLYFLTCVSYPPSSVHISLKANQFVCSNQGGQAVLWTVNIKPVWNLVDDGDKSLDKISWSGRLLLGDGRVATKCRCLSKCK